MEAARCLISLLFASCSYLALYLFLLCCSGLDFPCVLVASGEDWQQGGQGGVCTTLATGAIPSEAIPWEPFQASIRELVPVMCAQVLTHHLYCPSVRWILLLCWFGLCILFSLPLFAVLSVQPCLQMTPIINHWPSLCARFTRRSRKSVKCVLCLCVTGHRQTEDGWWKERWTRIKRGGGGYEDRKKRGCFMHVLTVQKFWHNSWKFHWWGWGNWYF